MIMERPRVARRMTHAIAARPWKRALVADLGFHATHQLWGMTFPPTEGEADLLARIADRFGQASPSPPAPPPEPPSGPPPGPPRRT
jgi:hypothetical protein